MACWSYTKRQETGHTVSVGSYASNASVESLLNMSNTKQVESGNGGAENGPISISPLVLGNSAPALFLSDPFLFSHGFSIPAGLFPIVPLVIVAPSELPARLPVPAGFSDRVQSAAASARNAFDAVRRFIRFRSHCLRYPDK